MEAINLGPLVCFLKHKKSKLFRPHPSIFISKPGLQQAMSAAKYNEQNRKGVIKGAVRDFTTFFCFGLQRVAVASGPKCPCASGP
jgi:hypothetical protein